MNDESVDVQLGIELFDDGPTPLREGRPEWRRQTSGSASGGRASRVVALGESAINAMSVALGAGVAQIADTIAHEVEQRQRLGQSPSRSQIEEIELTFGLKLTAGAGAAIQAFMSAGGESSVQVKIKFAPQAGQSS